MKDELQDLKKLAIKNNLIFNIGIDLVMGILSVLCFYIFNRIIYNRIIALEIEFDDHL